MAGKEVEGENAQEYCRETGKLENYIFFESNQ
jgi:hypothetical protein